MAGSAVAEQLPARTRRRPEPGVVVSDVQTGGVRQPYNSRGIDAPLSVLNRPTGCHLESRPRSSLRNHAPVLLFLLLISFPVGAANEAAVSVPVKLDYPLMRQLLIRQLFTGPGQSRKVFDDAGSCNQVVLTEPRIAPQNENLEIHADVSSKLGLSIFGMCFSLFDWEGSVGFLALPVLKPGATAVGLAPRGIWLTKADGERLTSGRLWDYAQQPLQDLLGSFTINLAPLTSALGSFLPDVLPHRSGQQMQDILDSLKLGNLRVARDGLEASLDFRIDTLAEAPPPEAVLSPEELQQWQERWQMMDALLVFAVKHYAAATHMEELRSTLLDILIDSRYQLVDALAAPVDPANDPVRTWFLQSWQKLGPVVRTISLEREGPEPLMWISVLAATDALYALDRLGPQTGLEISADGLRRLARMINEGAAPPELLYDDAVDPELQQLFQEQIELESPPPAAWNINFSLLSRAYAAAPQDRLNSWVPEPQEVAEYVPMVAALLEATSDGILRKHKLDKTYHALYRNLVLATAWQESCWRQYVVQDGQLVPLVSSTGDIGLMQMNERIWRGFYDMQKLRWDIHYNSIAGAEVLLDYLVKYALRRNEHQQAGGLDNLARASYSAYNGGPGKSSRYRRQDVPSVHRKIDAAFWKKYQKISEGNQSGVARCLGAVS
ncbi:MAG: lytic transglycosylase domain-containing protein [Halioglobus sp.]